MAIDQGDPVARATQALREDASQEWPQIAESVRSRVHNMTVPARPIRVAPLSGQHHDAQQSQVWLSSRVLRAALRQRLTTRGTMPDRLDFTIEERQLTHLSVEIVATYGDDLREVGAETRQRIDDTITEFLGPLPGWNPNTSIRVHICDIRPV
ncbi:hypothetical protein K0651_05315 [Ornithinimicrobium sp. Arc0846-15]|nr:hypothetical protein [Ornithinimicrobium laminariae]